NARLVLLLQEVHALQDAFGSVRRYPRMVIVLVGDGDVVEDVLLSLEHPPRAVLDDERQLLREARVVGAAVRHGGGDEVRRAVLVLQALARERGAPGSAADEKTPRARIARGPDQVADALEAEHRVVDVERKHRGAM